MHTTNQSWLGSNKTLFRNYSGQTYMVLARLLNLTTVVGCLWAIANHNQNNLHNYYWILGFTSIIIFEFFSEYFRIYNVWHLSVRERLKNLTSAWLISAIPIFLNEKMFDLHEQAFPSPLIIWVFVSFAFISCLCALHSIAFNLFRKRNKQWRKVAIIGASPLGYQLQNTLLRMPWIGYKFIGYYDDRHRDANREQKIIGSIDDVYKDSENLIIDTIYIALPPKANHRYKNLIEKLKSTHADVIIIPDLVILHSIIDEKSILKPA